VEAHGTATRETAALQIASETVRVMPIQIPDFGLFASNSKTANYQYFIAV